MQQQYNYVVQRVWSIAIKLELEHNNNSLKTIRQNCLLKPLN